VGFKKFQFLIDDIYEQSPNQFKNALYPSATSIPTPSHFFCRVEAKKKEIFNSQLVASIPSTHFLTSTMGHFIVEMNASSSA
jgi:hypothetical protein